MNYEINKVKHTFGRHCWRLYKGDELLVETMSYNELKRLSKLKGISLPKTFKSLNVVKGIGGEFAMLAGRR